MKKPKRYYCGNGEGMFEDNKNGDWIEYSEHKAIVKALTDQLRKQAVSGSLLKSLHQDLKGFQEMGFLTPDAKSGLGIAIEQVERYMRGDLDVNIK